MDFLPGKVVKQKRYNNTMLFRMESEIPPIVPLRLKIEINCFEHFNELGLIKVPFFMENSWFSGKSELTTYALDELLGTKLRALYQRKKGRDLYDLHKALSTSNVNPDRVIRCYNRYMNFVVSSPPTYKQFIQNLESKIEDPEFIGDMEKLTTKNEPYDVQEAYRLVKEKIIDIMFK